MAANAKDDRTLIAALERMAATGEPHHNTHDAGELLQKAVDAALRDGNPEVERAAIRAAVQIAASSARPVVTVDDQPLSMSGRMALDLPRPITFTAQIVGSIDGGPIVPLGDVRPGALASVRLPAAARAPGAHHVRLRAHIVYEGADGVALPAPEARDLPDFSYAVYDPQLPGAVDARIFRFSPAYVSARQLDGGLPDVPFWFWLNALLVEHGTDPLHQLQWSTFFCDERTKEPTAGRQRLDICAVITFGVGSAAGEIWIRTGHLDHSDPSMVQWLATPPDFEALRFFSPESTEVAKLSRVRELLVMDPATWPAPDVVVRPEDVILAPVKGQRNVVRVRAAIRNVGDMDARNVYVEILGGDPDAPMVARHSVEDVPAQSSVILELDVPCPRGYGIAFVAAFTPLTDYSPVLSGRSDPTPEDNLAVRVINPQRAPKVLLADVRSRFCDKAEACRGY